MLLLLVFFDMCVAVEHSEWSRKIPVQTKNSFFGEKKTLSSKICIVLLQSAVVGEKNPLLGENLHIHAKMRRCRRKRPAFGEKFAYSC